MSMNNQELYMERIAICKKCGLYKETPSGPICNSKLYLSLEDKKTISTVPRINFRRGCGCMLTKRNRLSGAKCVCGLW